MKIKLSHYTNNEMYEETFEVNVYYTILGPEKDDVIITGSRIHNSHSSIGYSISWKDLKPFIEMVFDIVCFDKPKRIHQNLYNKLELPEYTENKNYFIRFNGRDLEEDLSFPI